LLDHQTKNAIEKCSLIIGNRPRRMGTVKNQRKANRFQHAFRTFSLEEMKTFLGIGDTGICSLAKDILYQEYTPRDD
jgi:hypothetical protein